MNIVYMGTPEFAVTPLKMLISSRHNVTSVVTQPDREKGRGKKIIFSPVKDVANDAGIDVLQPDRIKDNNEFYEQMQELSPDIIVVAAYGRILPQSILDLPKYGCINIHGSLLPKYRGASPIQAAILNGDTVTGVTIMQMDAGMDTGDMLSKKEIETGELTYPELTEVLSKEGGELLLRTLEQIEEGTITKTPQDSQNATYTGIIKKSFGHVDYSDKSPKDIVNMIRAYYPWPSVYSNHKGEQIKIKSALDYRDLVKSEDLQGEDDITTLGKTFGTVLKSDDTGICVKAKDGIIVITELQRAGKNAMDVQSFLRGYKINIGDIFE